MAKATLQCFKCKQQFLRNELVEYAGPRSTTFHKYCPNCLKEQQSRDKFSESVCNIFGLKAPGPRIWAERKRLMDTYGYTDQTIIDCLNYIYLVEKAQKLSESLCLVNPPTVEKMMKYKQRQEYEQNKLASAFAESINSDVKPQLIKIKENTSTVGKKNWSLDDFFDD